LKRVLGLDASAALLVAVGVNLVQVSMGALFSR
jgi:hypothetical protein